MLLAWKLNLSNSLEYIAYTYAILPLITILVIAALFIFKKGPSSDTIQRIIDISKWYIPSVAIVFCVQVIENGITERETAMKEMSVFNEYVDRIVDAEKVEESWRLSRYFATVTPEPRLRERWKEYLDSVNNEIKSIEKTKKELQKAISSDESDQEKIDSLSNVIERYKAQYRSANIPSELGYVVVFTSDRSYEQSLYEINRLVSAGIEDPRMYFNSSVYRTTSKAFISQSEAYDYMESNKSKLRTDVYVVNLNKWCPNQSFNGTFYECR